MCFICCFSFEQLINVLQKKMPNGIIIDDKNYTKHDRDLSDRSERNSGIGSVSSCTTNNINNEVTGTGNGNVIGIVDRGGPSSGESLMSSFSSGSLHSPHVTMSGPVTDLWFN